MKHTAKKRIVRKDHRPMQVGKVPMKGREGEEKPKIH